MLKSAGGLPAGESVRRRVDASPLAPMAAAVWSTSPEEIEDFLVFTLILFIACSGLNPYRRVRSGSLRRVDKLSFWEPTH